MRTVRGVLTSTENQKVFNSAHTQVHAQQCQELKITRHWTNVQQDGAGGKGQALDMKLMLEKAEEQQLYTFTYETGN